MHKYFVSFVTGHEGNQAFDSDVVEVANPVDSEEGVHSLMEALWAKNKNLKNERLTVIFFQPLRGSGIVKC